MYFFFPDLFVLGFDNINSTKQRLQVCTGHESFTEEENLIFTSKPFWVKRNHALFLPKGNGYLTQPPPVATTMKKE